MNVLLFTHDGPIYMPRYLEPVLEEQADCIDEIILAPMQKSFLEDLSEKYEMFGPVAFVRYGLIYAKGKTLDLLPASTVYQYAGRYYSVKTLAAEYDIPVRKVENVNDEAFVESVRETDPDLLLSIACGQRIGAELLNIPDYGAVNIHGSLLPKYRGLSTAFWVLYHDEDESGVTAHYMTPEFDDGDILIQRKYSIESDDTMDDVYLKLIETGADVAISIIDQIGQESIATTPNNIEEGEYYSRPTSSDRKEFFRRGNEFR